MQDEAPQTRKSTAVDAAPPYDPSAIDALRRRHPWRATWHLMKLLGLVLAFAFEHWMESHAWLPSAGGPEARQRRHAARLRDRLVRMGPTYIKIGQLLSTRHDLLPLNYVRELETLQDHVPAFDSAKARAILREELGCEPEAAFATFDMEPMSAASIGQVHRATLHSGEDVVVKIQRPGLADRFKRDLSVLRWLMARLADLPVLRRMPLLKNIDYVSVLDHFGADLYAQIDFIQEARNMERFRRNFANFDGVMAPRPYWDFTTRRVLTQEFVPGVKFNDYAAIAAMGVDFDAIARLGVRAFIKQVLEDGYFHADTHPGNILITAEGVVAYIDFGMVDTFEPELRDAMAALFVHLLHEDFPSFITDLIQLGLLPPEVDYELVIPILSDIYRAQMGAGPERYTLTEVVEQLGGIMFRYDFTMPEKYAFLMRAMSSMEGIVLQVNPDFKFLEVALPFAAKILLSDDQRSVRARLLQELMPDGELRLGRLVEILDQASQEPTFQVGEFAKMGVDYLLSAEARDLRHALTATLAAEAAGLGGIMGRIAADATVDPWEVTRPVLRFLPTAEGIAWLSTISPHLAQLHDPLLARAAGIFAERLCAGGGTEQLFRELLPIATILLGDAEFAPQPVLDAMTRALTDLEMRAVLDRLAPRLAELSPAALNDALHLVGLAIDRKDLDLSPLLEAGAAYLTRPEAEEWRQSMLDTLTRSDHDMPLLGLAQRLLSRPELRRGALLAAGPLMRFLLTQEAADTRLAIATLAFKRLANAWPFAGRPTAESAATRPLLTEESSS